MESTDDMSFAEYLLAAVTEDVDNMVLKAKGGKQVKLQCHCPLGILDVVWWQSGEHDIIHMEVYDEKDNHSIILIQAKDCTFEVSLYTPKNEKPRELGFGQVGGHTVANAVKSA